MNHENETMISRRAMLGRAALGAGAAAVALGGMSKVAFAQDAPPAPPAPPAPAVVPGPEAPPAPATPAVSASDIEIVNYLIGIERLQAAYYAQIQGAQLGRAYLSPHLLETAQRLGGTELSHIESLEQLVIGVGGSPTPIGVYKFPANVFISPVAFTWFGHSLEEIAISAYLGVIGQIQDANFRQVVASIYGSEVRQAGVLRSLGGFTFAPRYFETPLTVAQVQGTIAPYLG